MTLDVMDYIDRHMISSVQNLRSLGELEASNSYNSKRMEGWAF